MSAPVLWIILPLAVAPLIYFVPARRALSAISAGAFCLLLSLLAWQIAIGRPVQIGPLSVQLSSTLNILGRRFILDDGDRAFLIFFYFMTGVWFLGSRVVRTHRLFLPLGLVVVSLLVAAQAVEPFLFAALLVEIAVLISIPILNPPQQPASQGVMRFVIFMTMALPFILLAGWASEGIEATPTNPRLLVQAALLLALGFTFWLAVFPFYTWVPLLTAETAPYVSGFILSFLPGVAFFLVLGFLDRYSWLRTNPLMPPSLQAVGALMVLTGGIWATFQTDVRRMMGYAIILESGFLMLALSLANPTGYQAFAIALLPRYCAVGLLAFSLSVFLGAHRQTTLKGLAGAMRELPLASSALLVAYFSIGGLPLLAGFPVRQTIIEGLSAGSPAILGAILAGVIAFWGGGMRLLTALVGGSQPGWKVHERPLEIFMLAGGILVLLALGLFPYNFSQGLLGLLQPYTNLR